jgi:hypothetical protein
VSVDVTGPGTVETYVVGFGDRPDRSPCRREANISDAECIRDSLTLDPARVTGFWGDRAVRGARVALLVPYLVTTAAFGLMVGLLILRQSRPRPTRQARPNTT